MKSPFLIGITGYVDPLNEDDLKEQLRVVLRFLKLGGPLSRISKSLPKDVPDDRVTECFEEFLELFDTQKMDVDELKSFRDALASWPGLPNTPIVVQTALAPGADSLIAEVALNRVALGPEFKDDDIHVCGVLPFEPDLYRQATTFVKDPNNPTGEEKKKQDAFDDLCGRITGKLQAARLPQADEMTHVRKDIGHAPDQLSLDAIYTVRLNQERDATPRDVKSRMVHDLGDPAARHKRYYAAGEQLAVGSHWMIAIWNGQDDGSQLGPSAVAKARLEGPRLGILSATPTLRMPHGGPLLVLFSERKKDKCSGSNQDESSDLPQERVSPQATGDNETTHDWDGESPCIEAQRGNPTHSDEAKADLRFPFAPQLPKISAGDNPEQRKKKEQEYREQRHDWLIGGIIQAVRIAKNLDQFNSESVASKDEFDKRTKLLVPEKGSGADGKYREEPLFDTATLNDPHARKFRDTLRPISILRRRAADLEEEKGDDVINVLLGLFIATLAAAILWHVFAHWHPQSDHCGKHPEAVAEHESEHSDFHPNWFRSSAGIVALLLSAGALGYFAWKQAEHHAEQGNDYRAIAEGVRVQFYWNLAGLGRSVSANYMHRQRSELDWIRGVVRATSQPYEQWSDLFQQLQNNIKLRVLRTVHYSWVTYQRNYFKSTLGKKLFYLHVYHTVGNLLALAGVFCGLILWIGDSFELIHNALKSDLFFMVSLAFVIFDLPLPMIWYASFKSPHNSDIPEDDNSHFPKDAKKWQKIVSIRLCDHTSHEIEEATTQERFSQTYQKFIRKLPATLWLGIFVIACCLTLPRLCDCIPSAHNLGIIASGSLLLMGAMCVAWAEKNFFSELAYQYQTMHMLFGHADEHVRQAIEELDKLLHAQTFDGPTFNAKVKALQDFLFALGKEALDENAEWLLLHRSRPLEPVMAG